ncbi:MAG: 30S ribosomal protein S13 [Candidatus Micrarchaeota archaeon]|nr:30S ribosomal protein S13 [Candidatus Micrarchaeota archaeon]
MAQEQKQSAPKAPEGKPKASEAINIVRIAGRDINGKYSIGDALRHIKGIGSNMAKAITLLAEKNFGIAPSTPIGSLDEATVEKLETIIKEPGKFGVPHYLLNRREDAETGADGNFVGTDLIVKTKQDMDSTIKLQTWIGYRRQYGQRVRGQHTRSTGRTGETVGVTKKKIQEEAKKSRASGGGGAPGAAGAAAEGATPAAGAASTAAAPAAGQPAAAAPQAKTEKQEK